MGSLKLASLVVWKGVANGVGTFDPPHGSNWFEIFGS